MVNVNICASVASYVHNVVPMSPTYKYMVNLVVGAVVPTRRRNMSHSSCHNRVIERHVGDCLISRFGPVNWPPRSCDLTPLDYFLWGYLKALVYADKP
ncbi:hypothetical protein TNCV_3486271 [Trichonephila clavipes]|nr:hypothetical protein TNCV_3486271 [Trichonephila clavipes]